MDLTTSAPTGAVRVGVQVIASQRRPVLEIYQDVRNEFAPPFEIEHRDSTNTKVLRVEKHRFQQMGITITLANIGGARAENISFELSGSFKRDEPFEEWPKPLRSTLRQLPPGQALHLMEIREHDLQRYEYDVQSDGSKVGKSVGTNSYTVTIAMHYDGPDTWLNRLLGWPRRLRGLKQFTSSFTFDPAIFHELPPPKYNG